MSDAAKNSEKSFKAGGEPVEDGVEGSPQSPSTVVDLALTPLPSFVGARSHRIIPACGGRFFEHRQRE